MKKTYMTPQTDVLDLSYAEPVCAASMAGNIPGYDLDPLNPGDLFNVSGTTGFSDLNDLSGNMLSL